MDKPQPREQGDGRLVFFVAVRPYRRRLQLFKGVGQRDAAGQMGNPLPSEGFADDKAKLRAVHAGRQAAAAGDHLFAGAVFYKHRPQPPAKKGVGFPQVGAKLLPGFLLIRRHGRRIPVAPRLAADPVQISEVCLCALPKAHPPAPADLQGQAPGPAPDGTAPEGRQGVRRTDDIWDSGKVSEKVLLLFIPAPACGIADDGKPCRRCCAQ